MKRQHSADNLNAAGSRGPKSPALGSPSPVNVPATATGDRSPPKAGDIFKVELGQEAIASPFKRHRASMSGLDEAKRSDLKAALPAQNVLGKAEQGTSIESQEIKDEAIEEEL